MSWFEVDKLGLAALLESRGKSFAIFELIQNAWDADPSRVNVSLEAEPGIPYAKLIVEDDSAEGWADLSQAFTLFNRSTRASDPTKRGRFCLGEKLVLSLCRHAKIVSTTGSMTFDDDGRRSSRERRDRGTLFSAEIRMTRDELASALDDIHRLIPPDNTTTVINGHRLARPDRLARFDAKLPTVIADAEGNQRPTTRMTTVEAFASDDGGEILEMGIPVCRADFPWRLNVLQKVPLGMDRDSVTDGFRRALQVAATNALVQTITPEQATAPWCAEAAGDSRISREAIQQVVTKRFGERAVIAVPGDPVANATAEANGYTVIHGGAMSGDAWSNVRKHNLIPTTSVTFPTMKPDDRAAANVNADKCPLCGK